MSQFRREGHVVLVGRDAYATLVSAECVPGAETVSQYLSGLWGRVVGPGRYSDLQMRNNNLVARLFALR